MISLITLIVHSGEVKLFDKIEFVDNKLIIYNPDVKRINIRLQMYPILENESQMLSEQVIDLQKKIEHLNSIIFNDDQLLKKKTDYDKLLRRKYIIIGVSVSGGMAIIAFVSGLITGLQVR